VADQDGVAQVQGFQERVEVAGEGVVVVADTGLARLAEPAAVVGDDAVAGLEHDRDLPVPGPAAQRVTVDQHDRPAGAMVLVVNLDRGVVLGSNSDVRHGVAPVVG